MAMVKAVAMALRDTLMRWSWTMWAGERVSVYMAIYMGPVHQHGPVVLQLTALFDQVCEGRPHDRGRDLHAHIRQLIELFDVGHG